MPQAAPSTIMPRPVPQTEWDELVATHAEAEAVVDRRFDEEDGFDYDDAETVRLISLRDEAFSALMLAQAPTPQALALKIALAAIANDAGGDFRDPEVIASVEANMEENGAAAAMLCCYRDALALGGGGADGARTVEGHPS